MKKLCLFLLGLALASLACLDTATLADSAPGAIAPAERTLTNVPRAGATRTAPTLTNAYPERTCARVTAETAVNLRPAAAAGGGVLAWLDTGDLVQVIDRSDSDWWLVDRSGVVGFARSIYLQEEVCQ